MGVVAAVSAGGAGAVFWMWVTALLGASTSFVESTLAQKYRQPDPLYGGQRGGPAYYIQNTAPAPPADTAATTPTRLPMPTRVAVETMSV